MSKTISETRNDSLAADAVLVSHDNKLVHLYFYDSGTVGISIYDGAVEVCNLTLAE